MKMKKAGRIIVIIVIMFAGSFAYLKTHPQVLNEYPYVYAKTSDGKWKIYGYPAYLKGEWCGEMFYCGNSKGDIGKVYFQIDYNGKMNDYTGTSKAETYDKRISDTDSKIIKANSQKVYQLWEFGGNEIPDVTITITWKEGKQEYVDRTKLKLHYGRKNAFLHKLNKLFHTSKKADKTTSKTEETSDWIQDRILSDGDVIEYKQYIFYGRDDYKIIGFDKKTKKKTVIAQLKKVENGYLCMQIYNGKLYYSYNNQFYCTTFDGKNSRHILDWAKVSSNLTDPGINWMFSFYIYQGRKYFWADGLTWATINKDTNKAQILADDCREDAFYNNHLYYIDRQATAIYEVNLKTNKCRIVRGRDYGEIDEASMKTVMKYRDVFTWKGKLYYSCDSQNTNAAIYEFDKGGKDKRAFQEKNKEYMLKDFLINSKYAGWSDCDDSGAQILHIYNIQTKKMETKKIDIDDPVYVEKIIDGTLLYTIDNEKEPEIYYTLKLDE